jgi:hypothetical protein
LASSASIATLTGGFALPQLERTRCADVRVSYTFEVHGQQVVSMMKAEERSAEEDSPHAEDHRTLASPASKEVRQVGA